MTAYGSTDGYKAWADARALEVIKESDLHATWADGEGLLS